MNSEYRTFIRHILKSPTVLAAAALICLNAGLVLWNVLLLSPGTEGLRSQIRQQETALEKRNTRTAAVGSKEAVYARNENSLQEFFLRIPDHAEFPALIGELFEDAKKLHLAIDQVNYHPKNLGQHHLVQYGLSFQLEGSYDQIKHMIFLLENSSRIIAINKVQFQRRTAQSGKVVLGLDIETYFAGEAP